MEYLKTEEGEGLSTALTPVKEAVIEKGEEEKALTEGVQFETDRKGTGKESDGGATAETEK